MKQLEKIIIIYAVNLFLIAAGCLFFKPVIISREFMIAFHWSAAAVSLFSFTFIVFRDYFFGENILYPYTCGVFFVLAMGLYIKNAAVAAGM